MNHGFFDYSDRFPELSDAELIGLAQTVGTMGEAAFVALCYRCRYIVQYAIGCVRQAGNPAGATEDELELEAWATIWECLPKYDSRHNARFATYVRAFVLDAVLREAGLRDAAPRSQNLDELLGDFDEAALPPGSLHAPQYDTERWAETADLKVDVRAFLDSLSRADRQLLELIYWNDQTKAAVARRLDVSKPAVGKRIVRLHDLARASLAAYGAA